MLNSYFVCFIIYIFFFNFEIFFVHIIFVPKIGVCFSFYPVSLIFEYEAKPHIRWPHIREYEAGESGANFTSVNYLPFHCGSFYPPLHCDRMFHQTVCMDCSKRQNRLIRLSRQPEIYNRMN